MPILFVYNMWKKVLLLSILALVYPVIESKKKQSDSPKSTKCQRTNSKAFRYCTKSCSADSDCKSLNSKCLCDGDCGLSCVKNNLKCDAPPSPKNSRKILSNNTYFGSVVTYSCSKPYKLRGSATRTCRAIRKWDGKKARCKIICKDPGEISFGNRRYEGSQAGKVIHYWCLDEKYKLVGSARITCLNSGQWSDAKPKCELPRCKPPVIPDTASVFYPRKMPKKFQYSDIVVLNCKDGYFKVGLGTLRCNGDDNWTGGITCSPKSCGRPEHEFSHGKIIGYVYTFKQRVRYTCDEGYNLDGPSYRQCQANEKWSGKDPTCKVVNCGPLKKPNRGDIIEKVGFTYGNRIVFECNTRGYEMKGSRIRTCQSDGTWSGSLTSCELVQCGDPGKPTNGKQDVNKGYVYGGSVTFVCNKDYTLEGKDIAYCQADKSWSAAVPRCLAPCANPGDPYQGNRIGQDFRHDHTVRFTCPRDYIMEGVSQIKCTDGRWSNNKPSCKAPCDEPARPARGGKWDRDYKHGRSVRFYCSSGYQMIGASSITCNDGTWNNNVPVCKGICGRPRTPSNGQLHGNSFLDGDEVRFSCNSNHDLFGNTRLRCVDRAWSSPAPECKARCTYQGRPLHGYYHKGGMARGDKIKHGVQITYSCFRSYTLVGAKMQECNNGRWTNNIPLCKATCRSPGLITNGFKIGNEYGHGKTVQYKCNPKYTLEGQNQLTCDDGRWSLDPPKCKASCDEPADPAHGRRRDRDFKHGRSVRFYCFGGYRMIGDSSITCNDGTWDNKVPVCKGFCGRPRTPSKGRIHGKSFFDGDEVTFSCDRNHDLLGNAKLRCVDRVWSAPVPECKGRCDFKGIPQNGYTPNQRFSRNDNLKHNSSVEYACDSRYTLTGSKVLHCNDGRWNASVPSCKAPCNDPGLLSNGQRNGNDYSHGQTVTYQCRQGYSLEGSHQRTCDDGKWDSVPPECKASCSPQQAPHNGKIHNNNSAHRALVSFSCNHGFQLSGSSQIKCSDGKWNDTTPTCKENIALLKPTSQSSTATHGRPLKSSFAVDGKKNTHYSHCTHTGTSTSTNPWWRVDLGRVEHVTEVNILNRGDCCGDRLDGAEIRVGNEITNGGATNHLCAANIQVPQGKSKTFLCRPKAYGRYVSIRIPGKKKYLMLCEVEVYSSDSSFCKNPGQLRNGEIIGDDYTNGSTVEFQCHRHYRLNGSRFLSCVKGKWNASIPKCWKNCQEPEKPQNGWMLGNNFGHGGVVKFWCKNKTYKLIGASQITCNDGNWSDPIPSCEAQCNDPGLPENGTKDGDDFRSRANVTFRCNPPFELVGSHVIFCRNGKWSNTIPTCSKCGRSLVMENSNIRNFRITSPDSTDPRHAPNHARLNGPSSWCTSSQTYLQIDLGRIYKVTAIATQGGADFDKWVKRYKIGFYAGATAVFYSESGQLQKTIEGNKDASSIVKYQFKEPFVTKNVRIYPNVDSTSTVCLRTEIYGCDPKPECILVGSMFWGLWSQRENSNNYFKAYITRIDDTHIHFALETNKAQTRSYKRTDSVLIVDKIPEMKDISLKASVIAVHINGRAEWCRTGIVNGISGPSVSVLFDDHQQRWVQLNELRLVKRPKFCMSSI